MKTSKLNRISTLSAALALAIVAAPAAQAQATSDHSFTGKVTLITEYEYRGLAQTQEKPAVQLNLDYAHKSGFYAGAFLTNISWIKETQKAFQEIYNDIRRANGGGTPPTVSGKGSVELDLFAGYKAELAKDLTLDVGYLRYEYPGAKEVRSSYGFTSTAGINPAGDLILKKPNTDELYLGLNYSVVGVKYSHQLSDAFGTPGTKNSSFVELNYSQEVVKGLTINGHVGRAKFKGLPVANYTVYRLGAVYDFNGWLLGAYVKDTNGDSVFYNYNGKDWGRTRFVASVAKTF
jgi:uncharacterized protein (TIGR02001 family)